MVISTITSSFSNTLKKAEITTQTVFYKTINTALIPPLPGSLASSFCLTVNIAIPIELVLLPRRHQGEKPGHRLPGLASCLYIIPTRVCDLLALNLQSF